ncbi:hypothetical protein [Tychonema bourrellyi]|uniref:hypothetical protein n=1 Tax=Tychonema bourrellyi TaxID=54313 RepID=UPI0015D4CF46|nr:hypothetical protein [Tychonema bourrellyi]
MLNSYGGRKKEEGRRKKKLVSMQFILSVVEGLNQQVFDSACVNPEEAIYYYFKKK